MSEVTGTIKSDEIDTSSIDTAVSAMKSGYSFEYDGELSCLGQATFVSYGVPNLSTGVTSKTMEWYDGVVTAIWDGSIAHVRSGDQRTHVDPLEFLLLGGIAPHGFVVEHDQKTSVWKGAFPDRYSARVVVKWPEAHGEATEIWSSASEIELYDTGGGIRERLVSRAKRDVDAKNVVWTVTRYRNAETIISISIYESLKVDRTVPQLVSVFKPGTLVIDSRLSASRSANYTWTGTLPSIDELRDLSSPDESTSKIYYVVALATGVAGVVLLSLGRRRASKNVRA